MRYCAWWIYTRCSRLRREHGGWGGGGGGGLIGFSCHPLTPPAPDQIYSTKHKLLVEKQSERYTTRIVCIQKQVFSPVEALLMSSNYHYSNSAHREIGGEEGHRPSAEMQLNNSELFPNHPMKGLRKRNTGPFNVETQCNKTWLRSHDFEMSGEVRSFQSAANYLNGKNRSI